jgi:hypothetical protein
MRHVSRVSVVRGVFDFIVPLLIAGYAIWALYGAVPRVQNEPTTPKPATSSPAPAPIPTQTPAIKVARC